jgi:hypothetical protein
MEECFICYSSPSGNNYWVELSCNHKLCHQCYTKLTTQLCPYCRQPFNKDNKLIQDIHSPSQQLNTFNFIELDIEITIISNSINNNRIERQRYRRRRRNLTFDEVVERRKMIKEKCKRKWEHKENRLKKWYDIII